MAGKEINLLQNSVVAVFAAVGIVQICGEVQRSENDCKNRGKKQSCLAGVGILKKCIEGNI